MVHGKNRIPYRIDRRLTGLAGPDYDATISFGLPFEPEDSQYGKYRFIGSGTTAVASKKLRRRYIGSEQNHDYCLLARQAVDFRSPVTVDEE